MDQHNSNNSSNMNDADGSAKKCSNSNDDDDNLNNDSHSKKRKNCLCCLKEVEGSSRCSQCRTALYCSRECQLKHWPVHKNICQDSNNTDRNEKLEIKAINHHDQGICMHINICYELLI